MPTFDTHEPIAATIELAVGDVLITATDRTNTVVEVRPSDVGHGPDVQAAEQTRVFYDAGRLLVKGPQQRGIGLFNKIGSIDLTIELPTGSQLDCAAALVAVRCIGRLGECRIKTSTGDIRLEDTGPLEVTTCGSITVGRVAGDAELNTSNGRLRARQVDGSAKLDNSNGTTWVGEVGGTLRASSANGDIVIDRAATEVTAATANGDIRIGELTNGVASAKTSMGRVELGIRPGTAARLDVHTSFGRVHNELAATDSPGTSDGRVDVRARTSYGDIVIRRSTPTTDNTERGDEK
ncbi:MAG: DUF4097 family beta strand repeat-containing protein [Candidatus Dormibacter sp.]|uniref:DUF4097 family beta strand repeat-containing protein n=1 Tax=Candidatus Dormibacter sp. TaxID=2973982 RepID=UPI003D9B3F9B